MSNDYDIMLPNSVTKFVLKLVKTFRKSFIFSCIGCCAIAVEHTAFPYITKLFIDGLQNFHTGDNIIVTLKMPIILLFVTWVGNDALWRLAGFSISYFRCSCEAYIKEVFSLSFLSQKNSFFAKYQSGDLFGRSLHTATEVPFLIDQFLYFILPCTLNILIAITVVFYIDFRISICILAWVILHIWVCIYFLRKNIVLSGVYAKAMSRFHGVIQDSMSNNFVVRTFNGLSIERKIFKTYAKRQKSTQKNMLYTYQKMLLVLSIVAFVINGPSLISLELTLFNKGKITVGDIAMIFHMVFNLSAMLFETTIILGEVIQSFGVVKKNYNFIKDMEYEARQSFDKIHHVTKGEIKFENITFGYEEGSNVFENLNLTIPAGQKVGIIGKSGSGKSTITSLITRNNVVDIGQILVDGQDIKEFSQSEIMKYISYIPQSPTLFNRSIFDNMKYANPSANFEQIVEVSKMTGLHDEIMEMSDGYYTLAGEMGSELSGGQIQRIAIARAILKNSPILILDEATSALDVHTEQKIRDLIDEITKNKTTIVIAHRLSTVSTLDRIIVLEYGKIVEDGCPDELLEKENGIYREMVEIHVEDFV
ncbi:ABC transporter ATP-binding protein [Candidatus Deianiraea vastatrix]|uniref:ABC transporter ATP-binding/permease n=1 Tax=Candidatus Deianiraea vastatrix TaxID=2163644 RepID=A0A5B8XCA3_9RICK|nr:ABC transporter ATP-binding protein [Candidatus Deianiraea vastatrix]QED22962.1 Putative ABC transporter ATP-binding/permease [Candidatus Deianiraea vastatrix]